MLRERALLRLSYAGWMATTASAPSPALSKHEIDLQQPALAAIHPCLLEHVTKQAAEQLPAGQRTPLLLVRLSTLLQDAVEAACMCARAHIDAPQLAKHLLSAEQYQAFQAASKDDGAERPARTHATAYAAAVVSVVGEVRCALSASDCGLAGCCGRGRLTTLPAAVPLLAPIACARAAARCALIPRPPALCRCPSTRARTLVAKASVRLSHCARRRTRPA